MNQSVMRQASIAAWAIALFWCLAPAPARAQDSPAKRPHILWLTCEDSSPYLGCYGEKQVATPNLDKLAADGVRYTNAFSTSGVCAPSRSCLILGVYPSSVGTQFMRCRGTLPETLRCFPEYLRRAGYYCTNNVKTDYNFEAPKETWDESSGKAHWRDRQADQPFFAVFNQTVTHESQYRKRGNEFEKAVSRLQRDRRHDTAKVVLPPYYPDTPEARLDWAQYLDTIEVMDLWAGDRLAELEQSGLADDTIVFFFSDHGVGLPRAKRWLYDSGTHVPLIVRFGKNVRHLAPAEAGKTSDRLVSFVDFGTTVLSLAGVDVPPHMQGVPFLGARTGVPREYVFGIRDRMDETLDLIRSVRDERYRYIRNYMPHVPYSQKLTYAELGPTLQSMRRLHAAGQLNAVQSLFFRSRKPVEELYDTAADPHEINNLADKPEYRDTLERLRREHVRWAETTLDLGLIPEPDLHERCGSAPPYDVVRSAMSPFPLARIRQAAEIVAQGGAAIPQLIALLSDRDPAVRYWGVIGLDAATALSGTERESLRKLLDDSSATVRVAAATALARRGGEDAVVLPVLVRDLAGPGDWARHRAALGLLELGPRAAPARSQLEQARQDKNEYVMRVAKRVLELLP